MPAASRAIYARSIKGDLCPKHQGRSMPEASRAFLRAMKSFFASDEELFCERCRAFLRAMKSFFSSDEEYS
ncbi:MAG: hypothetical protein WAM09_06150, partial [Anaerolineales bacterium]